MIARALRDALATDPAVIATFVRHAPLIDAHLDAHDAELLAVELADPTPAAPWDAVDGRRMLETAAVLARQRAQRARRVQGGEEPLARTLASILRRGRGAPVCDSTPGRKRCAPECGVRSADSQCI